MFEQFPKKRSILPKRVQEIYTLHYKSNREGKTSASALAQRMESWMHRQVAKDLSISRSGEKTTLEIGAGTLNQLRFEPECGAYDIIEPFGKLYEDSPYLSRVRNIFTDIVEVPKDLEYDRITSVATFEHILNLPEVVARCGLLLRADGQMRIAIPSEGTLLWKLGWKLTTGLEFRIRYGIDYGLLMKYEHVNKAKEICDVMKYFFSEIESSVFGLTKTFSFYQFYICKKPVRDRCRGYIDR